MPLTYWALYSTRFGLRLRAVGENPAAVDTAGISVRGLRYSAVVICGVLVGLAGVYLSLAQAAYFQPHMSAGKGFIALAALVFAKWRPWPALATCLLFGFLDALAIRLQGVVLPVIGRCRCRRSRRCPISSPSCCWPASSARRSRRRPRGFPMSKSAEATLAELFAAAKAAQANAYAPYSRFKVGAALRTPSGAIFSGCNVENAAYPQGSCAEAGAIAAMALAGERRIAEIVVIGDGEALCTPCGGCRQRIREFADPSTVIHIAGPEGVRANFTLGELLPDRSGRIICPCDGRHAPAPRSHLPPRRLRGIVESEVDRPDAADRDHHRLVVAADHAVVVRRRATQRT